MNLSLFGFVVDFVCERVTAPRYRVLPTETDLNLPPLPSNSHEKILPIGALQSKDAGGLFLPFICSANNFADIAHCWSIAQTSNPVV